MTNHTPLDFVAPDEYPASSQFSVNKTELYRQLGCMPELALEAHNLLRGEHGGEIPGVTLTETKDPIATIHTVTILNKQGSQIMQKPIGSYVTIFTEGMAINHHSVHEALADTVAQQLAPFIQQLSPHDCVLVTGLGNWRATPDALGPRVIQRLMATRHLYGHIPQDLLEGVRPVAAIAPGVLGMTGVESAEQIAGIVKAIRPKLLIVIDALAAGDVSRIGTTIQICDTGIQPGAGVANPRAGISQEVLGIPVISIGVPTVVKARIIAHQVLEQYQTTLAEYFADRRLPYYVQQAMETILQQCQHNLEVTPKEIDDLIDNCSKILAKAITKALHPNMNEEFAENFF